MHNAFFLNDYLAATSKLKTEILIESGDTGTEIAQKLFNSGVIKQTKIFIKIAINQKKSNAISPGLHEIDLKISAQAALEQLLDPARKRGVFGFGEGLRKSEILALLEKSKLVSGKVSKLPKPNDLYGTNNLRDSFSSTVFICARNDV